MRFSLTLIIFTAFFLLLVFSNPIVFSSDMTFLVPECWKLPTLGEADNWYRKGTDKYLSVAGDFNGDGHQDVARLLIHKDSPDVGLFALVSEKPNKPKLFTLVTTDIQSGIKRVGIELVKPGSYPTGCGKGYWDCKEGEPPVLNIQFDAISFFAFESAVSYYYWDSDLNDFVVVWLSD